MSSRWVIFSFLAACGAPAATHVVPLASVRASPVTSASHCPAILAENDRDLRREWPELHRPLDAAAREKLGPLLAFCAEGKDGAWSLKLEDVNRGVLGMRGYAESRADDPEAIFVRLALRYRDAFVRPSIIEAKTVVNLTLASERDQLGFDVPRVTDFDADGTPEVIVHLTRAGLGEDSGNDEWSIWSFRAGAIVRFAPLAKVRVVGFEDPDRDERFDPLVAAPYEDEVRFSAGMLGCMSRSISLPVLWHAVPPALRTDDAVAAGYAREQCKKLVDAPLAKAKSTDDAFRWAACQRMSGRSEAEVLAAYARVCPKPPAPTDCDDSICGTPEIFARAASAKPPLTFK